MNMCGENDGAGKREERGKEDDDEDTVKRRSVIWKE